MMRVLCVKINLGKYVQNRGRKSADLKTGSHSKEPVSVLSWQANCLQYICRGENRTKQTERAIIRDVPI